VQFAAELPVYQEIARVRIAGEPDAIRFSAAADCLSVLLPKSCQAWVNQESMFVAQ
jgi:hypothetical protein